MLSTINSTSTTTDSLASWRVAHAPGPASTTVAASSGTESVATHFKREASRILNASDLMGDPTSLALVQQALGIKLEASMSRAAQADLINSMINFHDFQIPSKIQQFIELYTAQSANTGPHATGSESAQGIAPQHMPPVSDQVLQSLQTLRVGGA